MVVYFLRTVFDEDVFQFGGRGAWRAFLEKPFKNILTKMFFTSVVEKSNALFEKTSPRKGCFPDLLSREAVRFFGKFLFDKKDGF